MSEGSARYSFVCIGKYSSARSIPYQPFRSIPYGQLALQDLAFIEQRLELRAKNGHGPLEEEPVKKASEHQPTLRAICLERGCPLQGPKAPKIGKRGSRSKKTPFPTTLEKGALSQEIPISIQSTTRKMGIC